MAPGAYERVLETLADIDARLAGLEVGYSEENAVAAREHVSELEAFFETEPESFVALRDAVEDIVQQEDSTRVPDAKEHADELKRQIEEKAADESDEG